MSNRRAIMAAQNSGLKDYTIYGNSQVIGDEVCGVGDKVVWNQLLLRKNSARTISGVTITQTTESITFSGLCTKKNGGDTIANVGVIIPSGHQVLVYINSNVTISGLKFYLSYHGDQGYVYGNKIYTTSKEVGTSYGISWYCNENTNCDGFVMRPSIIDLTQMFGAGNEPTTYEEYLERKPIVDDEYAYNAGTDIYKSPILALEGYECVDLGTLDWGAIPDYMDFDRYVATFSSMSRDALSFTTRYGILRLFGGTQSIGIYNNYGSQIIFNYAEKGTTTLEQFKAAMSGVLLWYHPKDVDTSALKKTSFPCQLSAPLHGIGGVADSVNFKKQEVTRRFGVVDLGTLIWRKHTCYFYAEIGNKRDITLMGIIPSTLICTRYIVGNADYISQVQSIDKSIRECYSNGHGKEILLADSDYTDAALLKTALSGVLLFYQLAEDYYTTSPATLPKLPKCENVTTDTIVSPSEVVVVH